VGRDGMPPAAAAPALLSGLRGAADPSAAAPASRFRPAPGLGGVGAPGAEPHASRRGGGGPRGPPRGRAAVGRRALGGAPPRELVPAPSPAPGKAALPDLGPLRAADREGAA